ncbi:hypothetical protein Q1695_011258 [Nippostrongylus brasiliensis]|nr:hypothetical protein Q1695_011258 [Nippostrongylus brasiliensis]
MANLEFHPFQDGFSINSTNTQGFSGSIGDQNRLVNEGDGVSSSGRTSNLFSMSFYRQFFDVETDQVLKRVLNSVVPTNSNFILDYVHPMPDLWGPFWISVTLVFSIGVFGNIAQYIENDGLPGEYGSDFRLVTTSATLVFLYVVLVPVILSTILWQRKSELQFALTDLLCAYGYSLSIFIPVSILWTLDINWFRWTLIIAAVSLSGAVLARALWPAFKSDPNKMIAYGSIFGVLLLHFLLAFTFKVYFFDAVHPHVDKPAPQPNQTGPDPNAVLTNERVQKILSSSLPSVTKDSTKSKENKEDSAKSNESKQKTSKEEKAGTASHLGSTVAPAASTNSSAG